MLTKLLLSSILLLGWVPLQPAASTDGGCCCCDNCCPQCSGCPCCK